MFNLSVKLKLKYIFCISTHSNSSKKSFRYIGNNDSNEEDDCFKPAVAQDKREDEERKTKEDSHTSYDVDEVLNFNRDGCPPHLKTRGKCGNSAHDSSVASADDNTTSSA